MPPANGRFKPFPRAKRTDSKSRIVYDFVALKAIYIEGADFEWQAFCERHGFNRNHKIVSASMMREWKRDWLKHHAQIQDDEIAPELLGLKKMIAVKRISHIQDWVKRSQYMKVLLDATLTAHGEALQHDQRNASLIAQKQIEARFKLDGESLNQLASAAMRIQDIEMKSLLLVTDKRGEGNQMQLGFGDAASNDEMNDDTPQMEIFTMGQAGLSPADSARLLANWFDQSDKKPEEPVTVVSEVQDSDEELPDAGDTG